MRTARLRLGRARTEEAGLSRTVTWRHLDLRKFAEPFDVGLATHLCGSATDFAQASDVHGCTSLMTSPMTSSMVGHWLRPG